MHTTDRQSDTYDENSLNLTWSTDPSEGTYIKTGKYVNRLLKYEGLRREDRELLVYTFQIAAISYLQRKNAFTGDTMLIRLPDRLVTTIPFNDSHDVTIRALTISRRDDKTVVIGIDLSQTGEYNSAEPADRQQNAPAPPVDDSAAFE